jgi:hypothetical protein
MDQLQLEPKEQPPMSTAKSVPQTDTAPESQAPAANAAPPVASPVLPTPGETIVSGMTGCTYHIGDPIGQGTFGIVYACMDDWNNQLAARS